MRRSLLLSLLGTALLLLGAGVEETRAEGGAKGIERQPAELSGDSGGRWAVLIGVDAYDGSVESLEFAANDARQMAQVLVESGTYQEDRVFVLTPDQEDELLRPTERNIQRVVVNLKNAQEVESVFFFFSGHGSSEQLPTGRPINYLYPKDVITAPGMLEETGITVDWVLQKLDQVDAERRFVVLDACRNTNKGAADAKSAFADPRYQNSKGTFVLYATEFGSLSFEDRESGMGLMTRYLIEGMRGAADGLSVYDGVVSAQEIYQYTHDQLKRHAVLTGREQIPHYQFDDAAGVEFPLIESAAEGPAAPLEAQLSVERARPGTFLLSSQRAGTIFLDGVRQRQFEPIAPFDVLTVPSVPAGEHEICFREDGALLKKECKSVLLEPATIARVDFQLSAPPDVEVVASAGALDGVVDASDAADEEVSPPPREARPPVREINLSPTTNPEHYALAEADQLLVDAKEKLVADWEAYERAIEVDPSSPLPPPTRDDAAAIQAYLALSERADLSDDERAQALHALVSIHLDSVSASASTDDAFSWLQRLVERYPGSEQELSSNQMVGVAYARDGEFERALPLLERVIDGSEADDLERLDGTLYWLGRAYHQENRYDEAISRFVEQLDFSEEREAQEGRSSTWRRETIQYLALCFVEVAERQSSTPSEIARRAFESVGERSYEREVVVGMADVLIQYALYEVAIEVYEDLQERWPLAPENPVYQNKIAQLYYQLPVPDYAASEAASDELEERYAPGGEWWEQNRDAPEARERARQFIEANLSTKARSQHEEAIISGDASDYAEAADTYVAYLSRFPFADDYDEISFYLADTYQRSNQYARAVETLDQLLKREQIDFRDGALYNRWRAYMSLLSERYGELWQRASDARVEDIVQTNNGPRQRYTLSELHRQYIEICDALRREEFTDPAYAEALAEIIPILHYHPAQILSEHGRYEEAEPRLLAIIDLFPHRDEAAFAASLLVNAHQADGELEEVARSASVLLSMQLGTNPDHQAEEFGSILEQTSFKLAFEFAGEGKHQEAAEAFDAFLEEFPGSDNVNLALYNAANNYERAGQKARANELFERYINDYPQDERSKTLYFRIADNYSGILELDKAVGYYERLYRYFPDYVDASTALYNAGFLRVGMGDYKGAAENFEEYGRRYSERADAETVSWQAGAQWERVSDQAAYAFYNRYLREFPDQHPDHVMQAHRWLAGYWESEGNERRAARAWEDISRSFEQFGGAEKVGPISRNISAEADFRALWKMYEAFIEFEHTKNEEQDVKSLVEDKPAELEKIIEARELLIDRYQDFEYTTAALYVEGAAYMAYAEMLFTYPPPEDWSWEEKDLFSEALYELAHPVEERGLSRLIANVEKAAEEKRSSEWIDESISLLNDFRPREYPLEKPESRGRLKAASMPRRGLEPYTGTP